jgi:hypothetical protein
MCAKLWLDRLQSACLPLHVSSLAELAASASSKKCYSLATDYDFCT